MTSSILWCSAITRGSSASARGTSLVQAWLRSMVTASGSNLWGIRLRISATLLSAPFRYLMVMLYLASAATHWCPMASRLGVVIAYMRGLLSVCTVKGLYRRYFLNWLVMAHLRARNSNFDEWYFFSPPFNSWLAYATGWYLPLSCCWESMAPRPHEEASVSRGRASGSQQRQAPGLSYI